ncbi:MAG TPA: hypothetical protein VJX67_03160 [Blastocatellia bacterium]|nr:hypothetical protein [Blastocatellia bacterium]
MLFRKIVTPLLAILVVSASAWANGKVGAQSTGSDPVSGIYKGVAKSDALGEIPLTVTIKNASGKITGSISIPQGDAEITDGSYADGKVTLKFDAGGNEGTVNAQVKEGKIVGEWTVGDMKGTLELSKAPAEAVEAKKEEPKTEGPKATQPAAGSAMDPLSGDWDGSADAQGNQVPFTLTLKLDGDKVSGQSVSALGTATITKGAWADNKLNIALDTPAGELTLTATLKDGKLVGDFDFAGQAQGKWEATKKK